MKKFDVIVVGGGMAGLCAANYCAQNASTLCIEKEETLGGLVGSFIVDDFVLDRGARGIIDSGIVSPMLKQLNIDLEFLDNPIKMMVEDESMIFENKADINQYALFLKRLYPRYQLDVDEIIKEIKKVMAYMDVLYGIENPLFIDKPYSNEYLSKTLLPWMLKFYPNIKKAMKMMMPIEDFLKQKTDSTEMRHIIAQHFFEGTPSFFALSYFSLYLQYQYPKGSTQALVDKMHEALKLQNAQIHCAEEVKSIDLTTNTITTNKDTYGFKELIWTANLKHLYDRIDQDSITIKQRNILMKKREQYEDQKGAESVYTTYLLLDLDAKYLKDVFGPHAFFTPTRIGLSHITVYNIKKDGIYINDEKRLFDFLDQYLMHTSFEISIPVLRDPSLAPFGKSAVIVSTLMDYSFVKHIHELGLYEAFKDYANRRIYELLVAQFNVLKGINKKMIAATPLTIEKRTFAHEGSLSGYSFTNKPFITNYKFLSVSKAVKTPFKQIKQAGQFTFNPAGVPVAILTGKLEADEDIKGLKK